MKTTPPTDQLDAAFTAADPAATPASTPAPEGLLQEILAEPRRHGSPLAPLARRFPIGWTALLAGVGALTLVIALAVFLRPASGPLESPLTPPPEALPVGDYPWYETEAALVVSADAIFRGAVLSTAEVPIDGFPYASLTVEVLAAAVGPLEPGDTIEVLHPSAGASPLPAGLRAGAEAVFLLALAPGDVGYLVNPVQGYYLVADGAHAQPDAQNPIVLPASVLGDLGLEP